MSPILERALGLWGQPLPDGDAALAEFRTVYTDPVDVNGAATPLTVLVDRARMMQGAFEGMRHEVHEEFSAPGRRSFAFTISGRHAGPLTTPIGEIAATGRDVRVAGMDIFLVDEDAERVTGVWAIADYLGLLLQAGVIEPLTTSAIDADR